MPRISVVSVVRNVAHCVGNMLESVNEQTFGDVEHVIVDGASTDGTLELIRAQGRRLGPVLSEPDGGIYEAMNKGIRLATGDVLFFLNGDDRFCDRDVLKDIAAHFAEDPALELVYGDLLWNVNGKLVRRRQPDSITPEYLASTTVLHQTVFAARGVFERTQGFSQRYRVVSDYEWMLKVFLRERVACRHVPRDIAVMDTGGVSWTSKWERERLRVMREYFTPLQILRHRVVPMQRKKLERYARRLKEWRRQRRRRS